MIKRQGTKVKIQKKTRNREQRGTKQRARDKRQEPRIQNQGTWFRRPRKTVLLEFIAFFT